MSGLDYALPVLYERTRELIASLVEASVQTALAAARNVPAGDEGGDAAQNPLADPEGSPDPTAAEARAVAGGAPEVQARGGSGPGDFAWPPGTNGGAEEDVAEGEDADAEENAGESDGAGGPQAFSPSGMKLGGDVIYPALRNTLPFPPSVPRRVPGRVCGPFPDFRFRERVGRTSGRGRCALQLHRIPHRDLQLPR
jgi:hypothetical protein